MHLFLRRLTHSSWLMYLGRLCYTKPFEPSCETLMVKQHEHVNLRWGQRRSCPFAPVLSCYTVYKVRFNILWHCVQTVGWLGVFGSSFNHLDYFNYFIIIAVYNTGPESLMDVSTLAFFEILSHPLDLPGIQSSSFKLQLHILVVVVVMMWYVVPPFCYRRAPPNVSQFYFQLIYHLLS
jgi:hypothetical protein